MKQQETFPFCLILSCLFSSTSIFTACIFRTLNDKVAVYKVTCLVDEGRAVDVVSPDLNKVFDTVSHRISLEKLAAHVLDRWTL